MKLLAISKSAKGFIPPVSLTLLLFLYLLIYLLLLILQTLRLATGVMHAIQINPFL